MPSLPELRAQLVRQQAELLATEGQLKATAAGTHAWGQLHSQVAEQRRDAELTKRAIGTAQKGHQSTLL